MRHLRTPIALLVLMLATMGVGAERAVDAQVDATAEPAGTIEVHARACDEVYTGNDWYTGCHDSLAPDTYFEVTNTETGEVVTGTTDASGNLVLALAPGTWQIAGPPGEFLEATSMYCATTDAGDESVEHPVTIQGGESIVCDYYFVPENLSGLPQGDVEIHVNLCIAPGCSELPEAIAPANGVVVELLNPDSQGLFGACTTGDTGEGTCTVPDVIGTSALVVVDPGTVPEGYVAEPDTAAYEWTVENPEVLVLLMPVEGFAPTVAATPVATATAAPTVPPREAVLELPAALYAGTCDDVEDADSVEELNDLTILEGDIEGAPDALPAASGYTRVSMSIDDLLASDHAVVVFDEDDPETIIACASIGGVRDEDSALSVGLAPVDDSGAAGVVYIAPRGDGSETGLSIFLVPEGLVPEASPTPIG